MKQSKKRLDAALQEQHPDLSRNFLQSLIMQGKVTIDGIVETKPGTPVSPTALLKVNLDEERYVSRAGYKLEAALEAFKIDVSDLVVLDAGISTGGFTDCLLQHGVKRVYGVDVGYGQVHEKIKDDKRVVLLERTNLRHLEQLPELVDLVTLDLSFISVLKVMSAVIKLMKPISSLIILIKPQFEADRSEIRRGGVVKDEEVSERIIKNIQDELAMMGFTMQGVIKSPILGAKSGNQEFLGFFTRTSRAD